MNLEEQACSSQQQLHEFTTLAQDVQTCYDIICRANKKLELELETVGREDHDKDLGFRKWKAEAKELGNSKPQSRKLAFIGRTGVGKSTAINAILGAPVLSAGADGACTSVQTEIIYEDLVPPSAWRASIKFIRKDDWRNTLSNMLDDLEAYRGGIHDDSGPAMDAWETLREVYPHLCTLPFPPPRQDVNVLLEHEVIESKLGTEEQVHGTGFDNLELQLRPYLTSHTKIVKGETPKSSVWHLVDSVRIYGAFDVLASHAVSLVDIPGFGDANKTRTRRTEEYIRAADVVVLVADIKRAADDQVMRDYFAKFLRKMIRIDGSMESLVIVLTGADVRINEDQLHYLDAKQRHVIQEMCQAIDRLNDSLVELQNSSIDWKTIATMSHDMATIRDYIERQQRKEEITIQLRTAQAAKNTYIAHQRSEYVREAFLHLYHQVYYSIRKQDTAGEPPPLPIFCVGSTDFNQLLGVNEQHRAPLVFTDPEDTGIPQLCRHIHDFGRRNIFSDINALVQRCTVLHKETKSIFFSVKRDPNTAYEDAARGLVERLKDTVHTTRQTSEAKIHDRMDKLEQVLQIEAKNAAERSLDIIEALGMTWRYQTYRAIMRREGEWQSIDLNEDLVDGMLDGAVSSVWHDFFNDFLKSELASLIVAIRAHCDAAIQSIKDRAKRKPKGKIATRIEEECNGVHPMDILKPAQKEYLSDIRIMQRHFGGSFKGLLRDKLDVHYNNVARESGTGMFQRMKNMNKKEFSPRNARQLYAGLVDKVMLAIRMKIDHGEDALDTALDQLYSHIERSFVYTQKDDAISKDRRKKMRIFLEEEYGKLLAELTTITDRCKELNTNPVD
jgi:GTPase SAR1 family protein